MANYPRVTHPCATPTLIYCYTRISVRLACLIHAASVRSEPESNSPYILKTLSLTQLLNHRVRCTHAGWKPAIQQTGSLRYTRTKAGCSIQSLIKLEVL